MYFIMREIMCEIMNIVTRYFDKRCVVIIHWNEDEKDGEVFVGKREEREKRHYQIR